MLVAIPPHMALEVALPTAGVSLLWGEFLIDNNNAIGGFFCRKKIQGIYVVHVCKGLVPLKYIAGCIEHEEVARRDDPRVHA